MVSLGTLALAAVLTTRLVAADVVGVVRDGTTGEPVAGAVVYLDDLGRGAVTGADGSYRLLGVPPGPQHVSIRVLGFQSRSLHVLVPAEGTLRVDLVLHADPIEVEAVVVRSHVPIRGVDEDGTDFDPARRLSAAAVRNDPFTAEPDVLQALVGGAVSDAPESGGGLHVRGGDGDEVGYLLDGIPVFSPYHSGVRSGAWNPAALARIELRTDPTLAVEGLSGAVLATTIDPADRLESSGTVSTSQVGLTIDGPLAGRSGFLFSGRTGYPGLIHPPEESSYVRGEDYDALAKLAVPLGGGDLRALVFDNRNVVRASSRSSAVAEDSGDPGARNRYAWHGRSVGLTWEAARQGGGARPTLRAWRADLETAFVWHGDPAPSRVESDRVLLGAEAALDWEEPWGSASVGVRATRDRVAYELAPAEDVPATRLAGEAGDVAAFARLGGRLGKRVEASSAFSAGTGSQGASLLPRLTLRVRVARSASLYAEYSRSNQALQSLRNAESVVGRIFPAELYAGGDDSGLPRARAEEGLVGIVVLPRPGFRLDAEVWARSLEGLALTDPADGRPFASGEGLLGTGTIRGGAIGASLSAARYAALASFGVQRVELRAGGEEWVPEYAAGRTARLGVVAFPTPSLSIRVGWTGQFGRRGTDTLGGLEWESCNLLDQGCEFAGSPEELGELGGRALPAYHRLDLSVRKHWHLRLGGRDARIEAYGTMSNLLGRTNVLVFVVDPATGRETPIEMRPRAPLSLGLGWKF